MSETSLAVQLQAILFVSSEPLSLTHLSEAVAADPKDVEVALAETAVMLEPTGLRLESLDQHFRLVTAPEATGAVRRFLEDEARTELSKPALETLAIVAYRGPVTRSQIEAVRGVSSETMLRNLVARGLVTEAGRSPEPGRPTLYRISHTFLSHFGLTGPEDLPSLPETAP